MNVQPLGRKLHVMHDLINLHGESYYSSTIFLILTQIKGVEVLLKAEFSFFRFIY